MEHELEASSASLRQNAVLDETGHFLLYTTLLGIKLVNIETNKVIKVRRKRMRRAAERLKKGVVMCGVESWPNGWMF